MVSRVSLVSKGYRVRKDQPGHQAHKDYPVLLGAAELMASMVLMVWMVLTVLTALLVHAVLRVSRDQSVPWVRKVPPGHRVQRGSRAHLDPSGYPAHRVHRDRRALMDSIWNRSRSTNGPR